MTYGKITHTQLFERKNFTIVEPRAPLPPYTITRPSTAISKPPMNDKQMPHCLAHGHWPAEPPRLVWLAAPAGRSSQPATAASVVSQQIVVTHESTLFVIRII